MAEQARLTVFHKEFREDLRFWVQTDRKVPLKALELVDCFQSVSRNRQA